MSFFEKLFGKKGDSKDGHSSTKPKQAEKSQSFQIAAHFLYQQPFIEAFGVTDGQREVDYAVYEKYFCDWLTQYCVPCACDERILKALCKALTQVALNDSVTGDASKSGHSTGDKHHPPESHRQESVTSINLERFATIGEFVRLATQSWSKFYPVVSAFLSNVRTTLQNSEANDAKEVDSALLSLLSLCVLHPQVDAVHVQRLTSNLMRTLADAKAVSGEEQLISWLADSNLDLNLFGDLLNRLSQCVFTSSWHSLSKSDSAKPIERLIVDNELLKSHVLQPHSVWLLATLISDVYKRQGGLRQDPEAATSVAVIPNSESLVLNRLSQAHKLYDSEDHGLSQNRFETKLNGYTAPIMIVLSYGSGNAAVVFLDQAFHNSLTRYGGFSTSVVTLQPKVERLVCGAGTFYFNTLARSGRRGLNVGTSDTKIAFEIDFDKLVVNDFTKSGATALPLNTIEVYGCGTDDARRKQKEQLELERKDVERARNRKLKPDDWESNTDREILELGGIKTRHSERGDM